MGNGAPAGSKKTVVNQPQVKKQEKKKEQDFDNPHTKSDEQEKEGEKEITDWRNDHRNWLASEELEMEITPLEACRNRSDKRSSSEIGAVLVENLEGGKIGKEQIRVEDNRQKFLRQKKEDREMLTSFIPEWQLIQRQTGLKLDLELFFTSDKLSREVKDLRRSSFVSNLLWLKETMPEEGFRQLNLEDTGDGLASMVAEKRSIPLVPIRVA